MLTPNETYTLNGVTINEKIIPDGTRWKDAAKAQKAGFEPGSLYKKNQKLSGGTGKVQSVTVHNTNDTNGTENDDGEQYTRATYNENMGSARVHFYVDDKGAWQNLKAGTGMCAADPNGAAEVSWHSGDGSVTTGGNMTSLSMEIIMGENADHDAKAKDNGARIAAWLLWKHGLPISKLVTHTYWVNKSAGKNFADPDDQCTNLISGKKWCPSYIFSSYDHNTAKKNWQAFKALVKKYLDTLNDEEVPADPQPETDTLYRVQTGAFAVKANADKLAAELKAKGFDTYIVRVGSLYKVQVGAYKVKANATAMEAKLKAAGYDTYITTNAGTPPNGSTTPAVSFSVGDKVKCNDGVKTFANGVKMASWVPSATLYVRAVESNGKILLVSTEPVKKEYTGRVNASDVHKI